MLLWPKTHHTTLTSNTHIANYPKSLAILFFSSPLQWFLSPSHRHSFASLLWVSLSPTMDTDVICIQMDVEILWCWREQNMELEWNCGWERRSQMSWHVTTSGQMALMDAILHLWQRSLQEATKGRDQMGQLFKSLMFFYPTIQTGWWDDSTITIVATQLAKLFSFLCWTTITKF